MADFFSPIFWIEIARRYERKKWSKETEDERVLLQLHGNPKLNFTERKIMICLCSIPLALPKKLHTTQNLDN